MTYITSRVIVMSCPTEGIEAAAFGNNIDLIKEAIESKHGRNYRIYNLANKNYRKEKFNNQVIDLGAQLTSNRPPPISLMYKLCANVNKFLNENPNNVVVINCTDGRNISAIAVSTLFMYFRVINNADSCLNMFHVKRGGSVSLSSNQYKFLRDSQRLFGSLRSEIDEPFRVSPNECLLLNVILNGIPTFNRTR